jgi:hypothetical protein
LISTRGDPPSPETATVPFFSEEAGETACPTPVVRRGWHRGSRLGSGLAHSFMPS